MENTLTLFEQLRRLLGDIYDLNNKINESKNGKFMVKISDEIKEFVNYFNKQVVEIINDKSSIKQFEEEVKSFCLKVEKKIEEIENFNVEEHKDLFFQLYLKLKEEQEYVKPSLSNYEYSFVIDTDLKRKHVDKDDNYILCKYNIFKAPDHLYEKINKIKTQKEFFDANYNCSCQCHNLLAFPKTILFMLEPYPIKQYIFAIDPENYKTIITPKNEFFFEYPELLKYEKILVSVAKSEVNELLIFWPCERKIFSTGLSLENEWGKSHGFLKEKINDVLLQRRLKQVKN